MLSVNKITNNCGIHDILLQSSIKYPSNIAVKVLTGDVYDVYSYSELYGLSEYIIQNIKQIEGPKNVIGILSEKNALILSAMAGVHKITKTFMLLDTKLDIPNLLKHISFNIIMVISNKNTSPKTLLKNKPKKSFQAFGHRVDIYSFENNIELGLTNDYSFIAMTSGSTGKPKFIQVPMKSILPNMRDLTQLFKITSQDVINFSTPLTFDPSMIELLIAITNGATLLIAPDEMPALFPPSKRDSITFWQTTPSKFLQHSDSDIKKYVLSSKSTLRVLALGGEPISGLNTLKKLKSKENNTQVYNLYGVTEMSCWATVSRVDLDNINDDHEVPLGSCLSNTNLILKPNEKSEYDSIFLESKSRKCVVLNEQKKKGKIVVDTGDLAESKNGQVYFRGRLDDTVKRFGNKVNTGIIESIAMKYAGIKRCCCLWLQKNMLLVLYYTSENENSGLMGHLQNHLEITHMPDEVIQVDSLPLNRHGKVSKTQLEHMFKPKSSNPSNHTMKIMFIKELCSILNTDLVYEDIKDKDFLSLGGTSFQAVALCNKLSITCSALSKAILPYLVNHQTSISKIVDVIHNINADDAGPRKKLKMLRANMELKTIKENFSKGFEIMWKYNTLKCVDATPTLFHCGFNLYVSVGSHSGHIIVADARTGTVERSIDVKSRIEASVLTCEDNVPITCGVVGTYDGTIISFSLDDLKIIWQINIGAMIKSKAVLCDGLVYIAAYDGIIRGLDIKYGNVVKNLDVMGDKEAISADLVAANDTYIVACSLSGNCVCIDTNKNNVKWRLNFKYPIFSKPVLFDNNKKIIFANVNGSLKCCTLETGKKLWVYNGAKGNIFSSISVTEILKHVKWRLIFGCHDNNVYCLTVTVRSIKPILQWKCLLPATVYATPCKLDENLVLAVSSNGCLFAIDMTKGDILYRFELPGEVFSSPAVFSDYIYVGCRDNRLYGLRFIC